MRRRHLRIASAVLFVALLAIGAVIAGFAARSSGGVEALKASEGEMPTALGQHLAKLSAASPSSMEEGANGENPATAEEQAFAQRAFPATDIPISLLNGELAAANALNKRGLPRGKGQTGTWVSVGPSSAEYPFTPLRSINSYVPNTYVAGGRTTALALSPACGQNGKCRLWIAAAGGGIWRTDHPFTGNPNWQYLSSSFAINSIGSITVDPNDPTGNTIYVGTGEFNACGSGCVAGVGIYKSTDGGDTWTLLGNNVFKGRAVGSIAVKPGAPNVIYAGDGRALLGNSSNCCGGAITTAIPGAQPWGLYKSTDGGASWTLIHNGAATLVGCTPVTAVAGNGTPCSPRGVRDVKLDPSAPNIVYASSYARGVWRSNDEGATWTQIEVPISQTATAAANVSDNAQIAITTKNGKTRMYVSEGVSGAPTARLFRSDDVATGTPTFTNLTSATIGTPGYGSWNICGGQCWYDNLIYTPPGEPDMVYLGGSYQYRGSSVNHEAGRISNGRAVVLSTDAGASWTDMTADATDAVHPNAMHPDEHVLVTNPANPLQFIEGGDGGVIRSSGALTDVSSNCAARDLTARDADGNPIPSATAANVAECNMLLAAVPTQLDGINKGLSTLQFQSLSVSPFDSGEIQGGTQDNGTWENYKNPVKWLNTMIGDGGLSGFDAANPHFRFHTFAGSQADVNFSDGAMADWNWIADPFFLPPFTLSREVSEFYFPIISDPTTAGTIFAGTEHAWRTTTNGMGSMSLADFRKHCNEWTGDFAVTCGDFKPLGNPEPVGRLTYGPADACPDPAHPAPPNAQVACPAPYPYGTTRSGGDVAHLTRAPSDSSTLWAATSVGRVFVSKNANAANPADVTFTRIDSLSTASPGRYITRIYVDPTNANHAWISYSGFSTATPSQPGHVFEVTFNPAGPSATFTAIDDTSITAGGLGDIPVTSVIRDDATGDLYVSTDFGVYMLASGQTTWTKAADGLPNVEVAGLTFVPSTRTILAATHGLGAWQLKLP
ncbi:MAG: exo-alpha-sialidase [Gaiellaceae bacterium]